MDFRLNPAEARFQREVHDWLVANLPAGWGTPEYRKPEEPAEKVQFARRWQGKLCDGGWAGLHWPREYGGRGATPIEQFLFAEEYTRVGAPSMIDIGVGPALVGPTLIHHGTEQQKRRFLRRILADWCILVVRTHVHAPKHKGLSFLLVDMKSPGITIRPLVEMTGVAWFNEVFFDDVRVPREHMVGELNQGWQIAITTLAHERGGSAPHARLAGEMHDVLDLARRLGTARDRRWRQRLAQSFIETEILRLLAYQQVTDLMREGHPGPEGSYLKLVWSETDVRMKELALEMEGPYGALARGSRQAIDGGRWEYEYLWSRAATIYAGTSEVQRNVIAQRVLGLPRGT